MAENEDVYQLTTDPFSIIVAGSNVTSSISSLPVGTLGWTAPMTPGVATSKPYGDYTEVKAALLIDRVYVPAIVLVGVLGNVLCFFTLVLSSLRRTSTCLYMAAIAVLDCVILIVVLGFLLANLLGQTTFYLSSDWTCGIHYFLFYFSIHFDVLLLLAMTVDRFIVVTFPLKAQTLCTPGTALKAMLGLGLFSFALNFQVLFNRRLKPTGRAKDPFWCWYPDPEVSYFMRKIYTWIDASIYSFVPFLCLLMFNLVIIGRLKLSRKFSRQFTDKMAPSINGMNKAECGRTGISHTDDSSRGGKETGGISTHESLSAQKSPSPSTNITLMLLLVSFTFLALTSPIVIFLLVKRYHWLPSTNQELARARLTHAFVDNLMYTNHAVNFLLYCLSGQRFRQELSRLVRRLRCW